MSARDTDFMNELESATRTKPSVTSNLLLIAIAAFIGVMLAWMSLAQMEEMTRGEGRVVPSQEIQVVQSLEGGILAELLVTEGSVVEQGQVLLKINDVAFASEEKGAEAKQEGLRAKLARLQAEAKGQPLSFPDDLKKEPRIIQTEEALYRSRQQELANAKSILDDKINRARAQLSETQARVNRLSESRTLLQQELKITQEMVAQKAVPKLEEIRLNREINDISGQIREAAESKAGLDADLRSAQKERSDQEDKFRSQALGELTEVETQLSQLEQSLTAIGDRVNRAEVRAPVKGVVNKIMIKTIGGVIEPAMQLAEIVPLDNSLKIMARVTPQDIAFLSPGQDVKVKITAYDSQRYGALEGKLARIGANSVTDKEGNAFFEIEVVTNKNYLGSAENPLPITPGMVAQTEIITGKRTMLEYLLKPVLRLKDRAFSER